MAIYSSTIRTNLTNEQLSRLGMPYQDVLREHWNQIPETVEKSTPSASDESGNWWNESIQHVSDFVGKAVSFVGDTFSNFGIGIQDTVTAIVILAILLVVLYFLLQLLCQKGGSSKKYVRITKHTSEPCHHSCKCAATGAMKV